MAALADSCSQLCAPPKIEQAQCAAGTQFVDTHGLHVNKLLQVALGLRGTLEHGCTAPASSKHQSAQPGAALHSQGELSELCHVIALHPLGHYHVEYLQRIVTLCWMLP